MAHMFIQSGYKVAQDAGPIRFSDVDARQVAEDFRLIYNVFVLTLNKAYEVTSM
jgi:hypothetical protein